MWGPRNNSYIPQWTSNPEESTIFLYLVFEFIQLEQKLEEREKMTKKSIFFFIVSVVLSQFGSWAFSVILDETQPFSSPLEIQ